MLIVKLLRLLQIFAFQKAVILFKNGGPDFIADPVVVDEMEPEARLSGMPNLERKSVYHALNQKAAARTIAKKLGKKYSNILAVNPS